MRQISPGTGKDHETSQKIIDQTDEIWSMMDDLDTLIHINVVARLLALTYASYHAGKVRDRVRTIVAEECERQLLIYEQKTEPVQ